MPKPLQKSGRKVNCCTKFSSMPLAVAEPMFWKLWNWQIGPLNVLPVPMGSGHAPEASVGMM